MKDFDYVPQYLDEPFRLILWTVDELFILFIPVLLGLFFWNSPLWGLTIGSLLLLFIKKLKAEQGHFFIYGFIYWYLPSLIHLKKTVPSHQRLWLG